MNNFKTLLEGDQREPSKKIKKYRAASQKLMNDLDALKLQIEDESDPGSEILGYLETAFDALENVRTFLRKNIYL